MNVTRPILLGASLVVNILLIWSLVGNSREQTSLSEPMRYQRENSSVVSGHLRRNDRPGRKDSLRTSAGSEGSSSETVGHVFVPRRLLRDRSLVLGEDLSLNDWVCKHYGISEFSKKAIELTVEETLQELKRLEVEASKIVEDDNVNSYFQVELPGHYEPLLKSKLRNSLRSTIGAEAAEELATIIINERFFSGAQFVRQIAFEEETDDPDAPSSHRIVVRRFRNGQEVDSRSYTGQEAYFRHRYADLADFENLAAQIVKPR